MSEVIRLPKMGLTMEEGRIERLLAKPGDYLRKGDILAEVETDKAVLELEMPRNGVIGEFFVEEGETVAVGAPIASLQEDRVEAAISAIPTSLLTSGEQARLIPISPSARRKARELGIDYNKISGTGPGGRIIFKDIIEAAQVSLAGESANSANSISQSSSASDLKEVAVNGKAVPLTRMRRTIAKRMTESITTIPQFTIKRRVDMIKVLQVKAAVHPGLIRSRGVKLSIQDFIIRAVAEALVMCPELNASFIGLPEDKESHIFQYQDINIGVAVAIENGLIVPVIQGADRLSVTEIASIRQHLVEAARNGALKPEELQGGTFTISNLGPMDVDEFTAIVNPPETGILAVGSVREEPFAINGQVAVRPIITLTGSFDHRVIDGAAGAAFLATIANRLQSDDWLLF